MKKMVKHMVFFAKGKRSEVYTFVERGKRFAVKRARTDIGARGRIENEVKFLRILNKKGIGPKLVRATKRSFVYEFVEGEQILDYVAHAKDPFPVLKKVLLQCFVLDQLGINKLEMHHPVKHILVKKGEPVMIDFERCYYTKRPKNVTQFVQFLFAMKMVKRSKEVQMCLKQYKQERRAENFRKVISILKSFRISERKIY